MSNKTRLNNADPSIETLSTDEYISLVDPQGNPDKLTEDDSYAAEYRRRKDYGRLQQVLLKWTVRRVKRAYRDEILNLTEKQYLVWTLTASGLDQSEIARRLGVKQPTVFQHLEAANKKIKRFLV